MPATEPRIETTVSCVRDLSEETKLLLVEADENTRSALKWGLSEEGFDITTAGDGAEALSLYQNEHFPIVIANIDLPKISGGELLRAIKALDDHAQIILTAGHATLDVALQAFREDAFDFIVSSKEGFDAVKAAAQRALEKLRLHQQNQNLIRELRQKTNALEEANALLSGLATHDSLTGLHNHRFFQERFAAEVGRAGRYNKVLSLLFIDLDYFKVFNDTHGHLEGDCLLRSLSGLLARSFRKTDLVARYGGDEFVVVLPETTKYQARVLATKLCTCVAEHAFAGCGTMPGGHISISIGCATFPTDGTTVDSLLRQADQALYEAKHHGRGHVR